ncbi:MAG: TonB-dependent receptor [Azoarcus sp.]|jgi:outer membrane receptor protein involved in Fe transport|nr:TonB-dependent receptor [Azoarcus sp.]
MFISGCVQARALRAAGLALLALAFTTGAAGAREDAAVPPEVTVLPEVTVTGGGGNPGDLPAARLPAHERAAVPVSVEGVQTFAREDIEALRPRDVFDLMETSLGMSITRQGSRINNFSQNRGGNVAFLIDGVYLTGTQAQRAAGDIPVGMIESISFVRDGSVLSILPVMGFGSRVSAPNQGVVVIHTLRRAGGEDRAHARASYGTFDTWKLSGGFKHSWTDGRLQLGGGYQHSASNGKHGWNNAYATDTYMLNGGWKDSDFMAMASVFVNRGEREIQRYIGVIGGSSTAVGELGPEVWKYDPRNTEVFTLNLARYWNDAHATALTYGHGKVDGKGLFYTAAAPKESVPPRYFKDVSSDLNLSHSIETPKNTFKAGVQRIGFHQLTETLPGAARAPREEEIYGLYVTDEYRITPALAVDASLRMDRKHVEKGGDKYGADGGTVKVSNDVWTDKAWLFALGAAWQIDPVWRVSGRYAWSRTPTPDTITTANDQNLPDERLHRWELGLDAKLHPAFNASFTPFYYVVKDAKVTDGSAPPISVWNPDSSSYENLSVYATADKVIRKGFELALRGRFPVAPAGEFGTLGYELGWSHFKDDSIDARSGSVETPENRYTARLDWEYGPWKSTISALRVDEYCHFFRGACLPTGNFTTVNLNVRRTFAHGVTVSLYGQNITGKRYWTRHKTGTGATVFPESWGAIADVGATWGVEIGVDF